MASVDGVGIILGFVAGVVFSGVQIAVGQIHLEWHINLGSIAIPPFYVLANVYFFLESPRWYISKGPYDKAFKALQYFRWSQP